MASRKPGNQALVSRAKGDPAVLADYADNIAVGLANLTHVYHPLLFILNGNVLGGGEPLREAVEKALRKRVVALVREDVRVVLSQSSTVGPACRVRPRWSSWRASSSSADEDCLSYNHYT